MDEVIDRDRLAIHELLSWRACHQPDKISYRFLLDGETKEEVLTYGELEQRSQHIALELRTRQSLKQVSLSSPALGLLLYPAGLEFISAFFGCLHASIIAIPSPLPQGKRGKSRIDSMIKNAHIDFILTDSSTYPSLLKTGVEWGQIEWVITDQLMAPSFFFHSIPEEAKTKTNIAFIQFTSGSTHTPKGVVISHRNLMANEAMIQEGFNHNDQTIFVGWLPFFHDMGLIGNILQPMYLGIEATLMSPLSFLQKPMRWLRAISRYRATTSGAPNFAYELCVEKASLNEGLDLSCWKVAFSGSETVQAPTLEKFYQTFSQYGFSAHAFYPCYGLAEATLFVSGNDPGKSSVVKNIDKYCLEREGVAIEASSLTEKVSTFVSVGHSWKDQKILIVDPETLYPLSPNTQGEICLQGTNIAQWYWKNEIATRETFQTRIQHEEGFFLRTGDLGFIDEKGLLYITSRLKDLIIIRGRNIIPQDIEISIIESDPALNINGCATFSILDEGEEKLVVVAEIKREYMKNFAENSLLAQIKRTLAQEHAVDAKEIVFVKANSIPKTSSGKIQRNYCKKLFLSQQLDLLVSDKLHSIV